MAVLQKIRNRGPLLVAILGIALLLFILQMAFEAMGPSQNADSQRAGEVNGEKVMIQDFSSWVEDWKFYIELTNPNVQFTEAELNYVQDQAWQNHVQASLIKKECDELGLVVTDTEVMDIIRTGNSRYLQVSAFMNPETGMYDYSILQNFLKTYQDAKSQGQQLPDEFERMYKYYKFAKENIANEYRSYKYQTLLSNSIISNPVEAQIAYNSQSNEYNVLLASVPFTTITDEDTKPTDADLKAKYNEEKENFATYVETRDIKFINVKIQPSEKDDALLKEEMDTICKQLAAATTNAEIGNLVRNNSSTTLYTNILKTKNAYSNTPFYILLDSTEVGETSKPAFDAMSKSYYTFKVLDKTSQADSVLYRTISVQGKDKASTIAKGDSILNAIKAGADFKELAKKYNQTGDSSWISSASYENALLDADNTKFITTIYSTNVGETKKADIANVSVIIQVLDKKNIVTKYNVASVVKPLIVSDETRTKEYNRFSTFLAANQSIDSLAANAAKSGYFLRSLDNVTSNAHNIANIEGTSEALRWLFDKAEEGDISQLFDGADNNMLVVYLSKVNPKGYMNINNTSVKNYLTSQVENDKKAEKIIAKLNGATTIADAKSKAGATVDTVNQVSVAAPTFVTATTASEPLIGAVAYKTEAGKVSAPFKGNSGVYMLQVLTKNPTEEKMDTVAEQSKLAQQWFGTAMNTILTDLSRKANVEDLRYKFY